MGPIGGDVNRFLNIVREFLLSVVILSGGQTDDGVRIC